MFGAEDVSTCSWGRLHVQFSPTARALGARCTCRAPAVPTTATGILAMTPATMMAKPSSLEAFVRGSP
eukprot:15100904-Alexandrium_andersonii.AAC.1